MSVTVKYFASLREQLGEAEQVVELASLPCKAVDVWQQLQPQYALAENILVAINQSYASPEDMVEDGDELAFFPPVTGG